MITLGQSVHELAIQLGGGISGTLLLAMKSVEGGLKRLDESVGALNNNTPNVDAISGQFLRLDRAAGDAARGMAAANSALRLADGYKAQKEAVDKCVMSLNDARVKLDALKKSESATAAEIRAAQKEVKAAEKAFERQNMALSRAEDRLKAAGVNMEDLAGEEKRLGEEAKRAEAELKQLNSEMGRVAAQKSAINNLKAAFGNLEGSIASAAKQYAVMAGAIAAAGTALYSVTSSTAAAGDAAMKASRKLRMDVEAFQELNYAAGLSGISDFPGLVNKMNISLANAAKGSGTAAKELAAMRLNAKQFAKMKPEAAILILADELNKIKDPAQRARAEVALFGKSGAEVANFFADGSEGIRSLMKTARESGTIMNETAATNAEAFNDARDIMLSALDGMKTIIGTEMLPVFTEVFDEIGAFFRENQDLVRGFAKDLAAGVREFLPTVKDIAAGARDFVASVMDWAGGLMKLIGYIKLLAVVFAAVSFAKVATDIIKLGKALKDVVGAFSTVSAAFKALGSLVAANPIVLAAAAIAAAAYLIYENWDTIAEFFDDIWDSIKTGAATVADWLSETWDAIAAGADAAWGGIKAGAAFLFDAIKAYFSFVAGIITAPFRAAWSVVENIWKAFNGEFSSVGEFLEACFGDVFDIITGPFTAAFDWVADKWASLKSWLGVGPEINAEVDVGDGGGERHFARGGIITRPTYAMMGEGHRAEAIIPLEDRTRGREMLGQAGRALGVPSPAPDVPYFNAPKFDIPAPILDARDFAPPKFAAPQIDLPEISAPTLDLSRIDIPAAPAAAAAKPQPTNVTANFEMPAINISLTGGADTRPDDIRDAVLDAMRELGARLLPEWQEQIARCAYGAA